MKRAKRFLGNARALFAWVSGMKIPIHAAHTGFFMVLSLFPTLMLILAFLRYTGLQIQTLTSLVAELIPEALMPTARQLILNAYQNSSGMVLSVSAITAIWSASSGMYGLVRGMNSVHLCIFGAAGGNAAAGRVR